MNQSRILSKGHGRRRGCGAVVAADCSPKPFMACLALIASVMLIAGCASNIRGSSLPSCANVRGYYNPQIPLGAERLGSRLWFERRIIYADPAGSVIRRVAARHADGQWQAGRMSIPLLAESGLWKTTVYSGMAGMRP
jgi:hypothetical protein